MIEHAIGAMLLSLSSRTDSVYGVDDIEMALQPRRQRLCARREVQRAVSFFGQAAARRRNGDGNHRRSAASTWRRLSAGAGAKGDRVRDWAYLDFADFDAGDYSAVLEGQLWTRRSLIRRKIVDGDLAFSATWRSKGTTIDELAKIEGRRWAVEELSKPQKRIRPRPQ